MSIRTIELLDILIFDAVQNENYLRTYYSPTRVVSVENWGPQYMSLP